MILRTPHYYKEFSCINKECKDNCCRGGWEIEIDDETADYYLKLDGEIGARLRASIEGNETDGYCFKQDNGQCAFLQTNGLCGIYNELGEDKMGVVCTQFPRFTEYYGGLKETGIGLACEEAARIILLDTQKLSTVEQEIYEIEEPDKEYDKELADTLFKIRNELISILDGTGTLKSRLQRIIEITEKLQTEINGVSKSTSCNDNKIDMKASMNIIMADCENLEVLNDSWDGELENMKELLKSDKYISISEEFEKSITWEQEYTNFCKYFIFRYFMKAAYDHSVMNKVQLMTVSYLILKEMHKAFWNKSGKILTLADRMEMVHIFSREVEYSEDNIFELYDDFIFNNVYCNLNALV